MDVALAAAEGGFRQSYASDVAQALGIIDTYTIDQALASTYGTNYMTGRTRLWNERFFHWVGLSAVTRVSRSMATGGALEFLRRHAHDPGKNSKRFLAELNLQAEDVKLDETGQVMLLRRVDIDRMYDQIEEIRAKRTEAIRDIDRRIGELNEQIEQNRRTEDDSVLDDRLRGEMALLTIRKETLASQPKNPQVAELEAEIDRDMRVRGAIRRFVDESILRPNAATRPRAPRSTHRPPGCAARVPPEELPVHLP